MKSDGIITHEKREALLDACSQALRRGGTMKQRVTAIVRASVQHEMSAEEILEGIIAMDDLSWCGLGDKGRLIPIPDDAERVAWLEKAVRREYAALSTDPAPGNPGEKAAAIGRKSKLSW